MKTLMLCLGCSTSVTAQVVTDGTVGPRMALSGPAFEVPAGLGQTRGANLFHSFSTFNLGSGESANFTGPASVGSVFARVTGGTASSINGTLRSSIAGADFYFINPAGVMFGPNAKIDVGGAFAVTTADYVALADGGKFNARPSANDVLTVAPPRAFGFLGPAEGTIPGTVAFKGSEFISAPDQRLTIAAGRVEANDAAKIGAPGGELDVVSVASQGELPLDGASTDSFSRLGNVEITEDAVFSTSSDKGAGRFIVRAENVTLRGASFGSGLQNNTRVSGAGGKSEIEARETLLLTGGSFINSSAQLDGQGGDVSINASQIVMEDSSFYAWTGTPLGDAGNGNGGSYDIRAQSIEMVNSSISANTYGAGNGGSLIFEADSVSLTSMSSIGTSAHGAGRAGDIRITKADKVDVTGRWFFGFFPVPSLISSVTYGAGRAGDLHLDVGELRLDQAAIIASQTEGPGDGGNVNLSGLQSLTLTGGASISASALADEGPAHAGGVNIEVEALSVFGANPFGNIKSSISSTAFGSGGAGPVRLSASQLTIDGGAYIASAAHNQATAGEIQIVNTELIQIMEGSIDSSGFDQARPGRIFIDTEELSLDGKDALYSIISANVKDFRPPTHVEGAANAGQSPGAAGNIEIHAGKVTVRNDAFITSATAGKGQGGSIHLNASLLELANGGFISADSLSSASGNGGEIRVDARELRIRDFGSISSSTSSPGAGGLVSVKAGQARLEVGAIQAETRGPGPSGVIQIQVEEITLRDFSRISSESTGAASGSAGTVSVVATGSRGIEVTGFSRISSSAENADAGSVTLQSATQIQLDHHSRAEVLSEQRNAGTVSLLAPEFIRITDSEVSAEAFLNGGDIVIDPIILGLEDGILNANAITGDGGKITIIADFVYQLGDSRITADSQNASAQPGTVSIRSGVDFAGSLIWLPGGLSGDDTAFREGCARRNPRGNTFMVLGRGGVGDQPDGLLPAGNILSPK